MPSRRVFNPESFRSAFTEAGLRVDIFGGYFLKPLSNSQIEHGWTPEMIEAFMQLGECFPNIAGESMAAQCRQIARSKYRLFSLVFLTKLAQDAFSEEFQIGHSFAQRRNTYRRHAQSKHQVFSEPPASDFFLLPSSFCILPSRQA